MSVADIQTFLKDSAQETAVWLKNGECRFLSQVTNTDNQGFPTKAFQPRTAGFLPCVWKIKNESERDAGEVTIGSQARALIRYSVTLPQKVNGADVIAEPSDRIELKLSVGASDVITHDIVAVVPLDSVNWLVLTSDIGKQL